MNLKILIIILAVIYLAVCAIVYFFQEKMIFFPRRISESHAKHILEKHPNVVEVSIEAEDGVILHGWLVINHRPAPLVIYFGGNAEELSWLLDYHEFPGEWSFMLINYRGYGLSEGKPSEKKMKEDALRVYDYAREKILAEGMPLVVLGRSLGSGVATHVARHRPTDAVILVSPFDSVLRLAKSIFPFLPVRLILKHPFRSDLYAPHIKTPLLCVVAEEDEIVPVTSSMRLFKAWGGTKELVIIDGEDHNSLADHKNYWHSIRHFLHQIAAE